MRGEIRCRPTAVRCLIGLVFIILVVSHDASAQDKGFGLGVLLGEPTGVSGKYWLGRTTAIDGALAWSFWDNTNVHIHGDHLWHNFGIFNVQTGKLPLYYGLGGRVKLGDETRFGIRIPVGLDYLFASAPVDIFLEIVPVVDLAPSTSFRLNGAIGVRYFFP